MHRAHVDCKFQEVEGIRPEHTHTFFYHKDEDGHMTFTLSQLSGNILHLCAPLTPKACGQIAMECMQHIQGSP